MAGRRARGGAQSEGWHFSEGRGGRGDGRCVRKVAGRGARRGARWARRRRRLTEVDDGSTISHHTG